MGSEGKMVPTNMWRANAWMPQCASVIGQLWMVTLYAKVGWRSVGGMW